LYPYTLGLYQLESTIIIIDVLLGVVTIKQAKKDVKWALKTVKIGEIFMFYLLKQWQPWQVGPFSFI